MLFASAIAIMFAALGNFDGNDPSQAACGPIGNPTWADGRGLFEEMLISIESRRKEVLTLTEKLRSSHDAPFLSLRHRLPDHEIDPHTSVLVDLSPIGNRVEVATLVISPKRVVNFNIHSDPLDIEEISSWAYSVSCRKIDDAIRMLENDA